MSNTILQFSAVELLRAFNTAMNEALAANIKNMTTALAMLFQVAPPGLWGEALHLSGVFATIVKGLEEDKVRDSISCSLTALSDPPPQLPTLTLTDYVYVLARIAVADRQLFLQLVSAMAATQNVNESLIWEAILNQWWTRVRELPPSCPDLRLKKNSILVQFDNMSEPRLRKLTAMGIANLVASGRPEVLDRLSTEIFNLWIDVFGEIKEAQNNAEAEYVRDPLLFLFCVLMAKRPHSSSLTLYWDRPFDEIYTESEGTLEHERRKAVSTPTRPSRQASLCPQCSRRRCQVFDNDPVRTTSLTAYIGARWREAEQACPDLQARYLSKAEPELLKQIYDALTGNRP